MANPFDSVIGSDEPSQPVRNAAPARKPSLNNAGEDVQLSFSFNKRMIERGIFCFIILALAVLVAFNPFGGSCEVPVTGAVVATNDDIEVVQVPDEPEVELEAEKEPEPKEEVKEEPKEEPEEEKEEPKAETSFEKDFTFAFSTIDMKRDEHNYPLLMNSIKVVLKNNWKSFTPKMVVYWYDIKSPDHVRTKVRTTWIGSRIKEGAEQVVTIDDFDYKLIEQRDGKETIVIELYDANTNELLETYDKTVG